MILACPGCDKTYRVPRAAVPPEGREVRCSACGTGWTERGRVQRLAASGAAAADVVSYYGAAPCDDPCDDPCDGPGDEAHAASADAPCERGAAPAPAPAPDAVIEGTCDAPPRVGVRLAVPNDAPVRSPVLDQQRALTIRYEQPPAGASGRAVAAPMVGPACADEPPVLDEALRLLRRLTRPLSTYLRRVLRDAIGVVPSLLARRANRRAPSSPPGSPSAGEAAARRTRSALRARAANRLTPLRAVGWLGWSVSCAVVVVIAAAPVEVARWVPALAPLAPPPPAAPQPLSVAVQLDRYVLSDQGPAVLLSGTIRNEGGEVIPELVLIAGPAAGENSEEASVPLPPVLLPPGGERPFAVRVLVPTDTRTVRLAVRAAQTVAGADRPPQAPTGPSEPIGGYRMQERGGGWSSGHPGPPDAARR